MDISAVFSFVGIGFFVSWASIPLILKGYLQRRNTSANREFHHTHKEAISRFGGVALVAAFLILSLLALWWFPNPEKTKSRLVILFTTLAMFALGFVDDLRPLGAKRKLLAQIIIASTAYFLGIQISNFKNPINHQIYELGWLGWPATVLWLVAITNLINLIDGIDGFAGGVVLMLMLLLMYVGLASGLAYPVLCAAGMCGALVGFLYYNFPPAKIYLGDGGAYFLGFLIGLLALTNSQKGTIAAAMIAPVFALALPITDVALAILRRGLKGLPIFRPDRKHIHHRLQESGQSRMRTVLVLYAVSLVCLAAAFGIFLLQRNWLPVLFGAIFVVILATVRSFRSNREWFSVGKVVGNSLEMRKEIKYILTLGRWLELESERSESIDLLWEDFKFMARKLDLSRVELHRDGTNYVWENAPQTENASEVRKMRHELGGKESMWMEFMAPTESCSEKHFELMSELMAEAWMKATAKWQTLHEEPLQFKTSADQTTSGALSDVAR